MGPDVGGSAALVYRTSMSSIGTELSGTLTLTVVEFSHVPAKWGGAHFLSPLAPLDSDIDERPGDHGGSGRKRFAPGEVLPACCGNS